MEAGTSFAVEAFPPTPIRQAQQRVDVSYVERKRVNGSPPHSFDCYGFTIAGQLKITFSCVTSRNLPAGEYEVEGDVVITRQETGDSLRYKGVRFPIVTLTANPYDKTEFPEIVGTALALNRQQAFQDAASRGEMILERINAHFPLGAPDGKQARAYLQAQAEDCKTLVHLTRDRYIKAMPSEHPIPAVFDDFDKRFDQVIRDLGGTPSKKASLELPANPYFVLAQLPQSSESVEAKSGAATLDKRVKEFILVLSDLIEGCKKLADSGTDSFTWAIVSTPPGAEVWYARRDITEKQWVGRTNLDGQSLDYAIWTFRVDWNGCYSKPQTPDPFQQKIIAMTFDMAGCKSR